jgi:hypothetical protein
VDKHELWAGEAIIEFDNAAPFSAPGRVWTTFNPKPTTRFRVDFGGGVSGITQLRLGPATLRLDARRMFIMF